MARYTLNQAAVDNCRRLIDARQYVLNSDWGEVQPRADTANSFLERHSWQEYAAWHLGLTEGASDETKARYAFVYGDFRRVHRTALIACVYRASEWRHKEIELAAHDLLQHLDATSGYRSETGRTQQAASAWTAWYAAGSGIGNSVSHLQRKLKPTPSLGISKRPPVPMIMVSSRLASSGVAPCSTRTKRSRANSG